MSNLTQPLSDTELAIYVSAWAGGDPAIQYISRTLPYRAYRWTGTNLTLTTVSFSYTAATFAALSSAIRTSLRGATITDSASPYSVLGVVDGSGYLQTQSLVADISAKMQLFTTLANYTETSADTANADVTQVGSGATGSIRFTSTAVGSKNAYIDADRTINLNLTGGLWLCWRQNFKQSAVQNGLTAT